MSRVQFDNELLLLHNELIKMGAMIEEAIRKSIKAFEENDKELAREVSTGDKAVDDLERAIEQRCLRLLLRQQPVAHDLRTISTAVKIITDMERIGDQAEDIADIALRSPGGGLADLTQHIPQMAQVAMEMVNSSIQAFIDRDLDLAKKIRDRDDEVDTLFITVCDELVNLLKTKTDIAERAVDAIMVVKYLERIGDHAVNICEWVEFMETGVHKDMQIL
ncbi:MAG: phosphate signaling complex protein PhoU [Clostridia bacterium]|nr:phosphate signaling complex protein PhoU [Clostridia bacterium]